MGHISLLTEAILRLMHSKLPSAYTYLNILMFLLSDGKEDLLDKDFTDFVSIYSPSFPFCIMNIIYTVQSEYAGRHQDDQCLPSSSAQGLGEVPREGYHHQHWSLRS